MASGPKLGFRAGAQARCTFAFRRERTQASRGRLGSRCGHTHSCPCELRFPRGSGYSRTGWIRDGRACTHRSTAHRPPQHHCPRPPQHHCPRPPQHHCPPPPQHHCPPPPQHHCRYQHPGRARHSPSRPRPHLRLVREAGLFRLGCCPRGYSRRNEDDASPLGPTSHNRRSPNLLPNKRPAPHRLKQATPRRQSHRAHR